MPRLHHRHIRRRCLPWIGSRLIALTLVAIVASMVLLAWGARPGGAGGGTWLTPVQDRYEPGDTATVLGYSDRPTERSEFGAVDDGPYYGYLRVAPDLVAAEAPPDRWPYVHPSDLPLGPVAVEDTGRNDMFAVRASLTFTLPADLPPGAYDIVVCDDPCTRTLGLVLGGNVWVGVDPPRPIDRMWLVDDPAVALLADDALVAGLPASVARTGGVIPWYEPVPTTVPEADRARGAAGAGSAQAADEHEVDAGDDGVSGPAVWLVAFAVIVVGWGLAWRLRPPRPTVGAAPGPAAGPASDGPAHHPTADTGDGPASGPATETDEGRSGRPGEPLAASGRR